MTGKRIRILHYINQFFAGIGGEEQAGVEVRVLEGPVGPALGLQQQLADRGNILATLAAGDDYFGEQSERAAEQIREALVEVQPDCVVAGPAFNSGRYGLACGQVCRIAAELEIPALTAMFPGNPAVDLYRSDVWILPTTVSARGMREVLPRLAEFALRLCSGVELGRPEEEGYLPRGIRRNELTELPAAERAVAMLRAKLGSESFQTEVPVRIFDAIEPAPPISDLSGARIALVSTGGIVPRGNPDGLKHVNESRWQRYSISQQPFLRSEDWEPIHGGFDASHARSNPSLIVPLDGLREFQSRGCIGSIPDIFYSVVGVGNSTATCTQIGDELAVDLLKEGVTGVILTST